MAHDAGNIDGRKVSQMAKETNDMMNDAELDRLLHQATRPVVPLGAANRIASRVAQMELLQKPAQKSDLRWLAGLPLAASLALGIFLGTQGYGDDVLGATSSAALATTLDSEFETGTEEAEQVAEEDVS